MKRINLLGFVAVLMLFFTACEEDPITGPIGTIDPSVNLSLSGQVSSDTELAPNSTFSVILSASKGDNDLQAVTVLEDGLSIDNSRLTINGSGAAANPVLIFAPDTEGFSWTIDVEAQNTVAADKTFTFRVQDGEGNSDEVSVIISTSAMAPLITVEGSGNYETSPNVPACITLTAAIGDANLTTIEILEDDGQGNYELVTDLAILYFNELSMNFASNPLDLEAEDQDGFAKPIYIRPDYAGIGSYRVVITDENGLTSSGDFTITSGTALTTELTGVLFNAAGPTGTGGLDLDTGESTGSSDADAEIRDAGIDMDEPNDTNWLQRIGGVNEASMRKINGQLPEGIGYADLNFVEFLSAFYDSSEDFAFVGSDGGLFSDVVAVGDIFVVRAPNKEYIIEVSEVNVKVADNGDSYTLNIKH